MRGFENGVLSSVRITLTACAVDLLDPAIDGTSTTYSVSPMVSITAQADNSPVEYAPYLRHTIGPLRSSNRAHAGGMGEVYLVEDTQLGRHVAIKFLPPETVSDDHARKRLLRARAVATLDHPNICSIYEIDEADGQLHRDAIH